MSAPSSSTFSVTGALVHDAFRSHWHDWQNFLSALSTLSPKSAHINVRFENTSSWDSSAVALMLAMRRDVFHQHQSLSWENLPEGIHALADIYNAPINPDAPR